MIFRIAKAFLMRYIEIIILRMEGFCTRKKERTFRPRSRGGTVRFYVLLI